VRPVGSVCVLSVPFTGPDSAVWSPLMEPGRCSQSRFRYRLHRSPVPHSDRLISARPLSLVRRTGAQTGAPPVDMSHKDTCVSAYRIKTRPGLCSESLQCGIMFPLHYVMQ